MYESLDMETNSMDKLTCKVHTKSPLQKTPAKTSAPPPSIMYESVDTESNMMDKANCKLPKKSPMQKTSPSSVPKDIHIFHDDSSVDGIPKNFEVEMSVSQIQDTGKTTLMSSQSVCLHIALKKG